MELHDRKTIAALLQKYGLLAKKSFGQNFLTSKLPIFDILEAAKVCKEDTVIEIGPGLGILTEELAKTANRVITLELDRNLIPLLSETLKDHKNIEILNQDALKYTPPNIRYKIVANIPYNITSHLINHFLQAENQPVSITLLVQKEVAEKICVLDPDMTVLSLEVALFGKAKIIKKVPPSYFYPQPKVDSAIIHIEIYNSAYQNYIPKEKAMQILKVAKICFSNRRKQLKNTLPAEYHQKASGTNLDLSRRPETLSIKEWFSLFTSSPAPDINLR